MVAETHKNRQAGAGIKVTPQMIEAGVAELAVYDRDIDLGDQVVIQIYLAMVRADRERRAHGKP